MASGPGYWDMGTGRWQAGRGTGIQDGKRAGPGYDYGTANFPSLRRARTPSATSATSLHSNRVVPMRSFGSDGDDAAATYEVKRTATFSTLRGSRPGNRMGSADSTTSFRSNRVAPMGSFGSGGDDAAATEEVKRTATFSTLRGARPGHSRGSASSTRSFRSNNVAPMTSLRSNNVGSGDDAAPTREVKRRECGCWKGYGHGSANFSSVRGTRPRHRTVERRKSLPSSVGFLVNIWTMFLWLQT